VSERKARAANGNASSPIFCARSADLPCARRDLGSRRSRPCTKWEEHSTPQLYGVHEVWACLGGVLFGRGNKDKDVWRVPRVVSRGNLILCRSRSGREVTSSVIPIAWETQAAERHPKTAGYFWQPTRGTFSIEAMHKSLRLQPDENFRHDRKSFDFSFECLLAA
jgi:hypothetical protein